MAYIEEPKGVTFTVDSRGLTVKDKKEIREFIRLHKKKLRLKETVKLKKFVNINKKIE